MGNKFDRVKPIYWALYFFEKLRLKKIARLNGVEIAYAYSSRSEYFSRCNELKKEPDTVRWIDDLEGVTHFVDIGACVGTYGIYFGKKNPDAELMFVEPFGLNYAALLKNLRLNHLEGRAIPLNAALSGQAKTIFLNPSSAVPGSSMHENVRFDDAMVSSDDMQKTACIVFDDLFDRMNNIERIAIKIDVDGPEVDIVRDLSESEVLNRTHDICVEVNLITARPVTDLLIGCGFSKTTIAGEKLENATGYNLYFKRGEK